MKKGISIWSFAEGTLKDKMKLAKEAGFDGIELALDETGEVSMESTKEDLAKVKAYAEEIGIEISSLATMLYWTYNYTSANLENRQKAMEITKKQLEVAAELGCDTILVVPGAVEVSFDPGEVVEYDVAYERAQSALKELAPYAEKLGVCIGVENVGNRFLLSPLEEARFIDEIGSDYVGAYFDVGNVVPNGFPEHWIKILGSRIKKVHIKDYKRKVSGYVDLLEGDVNWPKVMEGFKNVGYDNWVTAEMLPPYRYYPEVLIYNTSNAMDKILERK